MKHAYLDTNVILTLLRSQEENYSFVQTLASLRNFTFFTGTMTIIEITSVLAREENLFREAIQTLASELDIRELISLSFEEQIIIIIELLFKTFNLSVLDEPVQEILQINGKKVILPSLYILGIKWADRIKLRTLDLVHIMTILFYKKIKEIKFDYFITSDLVILGKRIDIQTNIETIVTDPEGLLKIET